MSKVALIARGGKRRNGAFDQVFRDFIEKARWLGGLVFAEDAPPRGTRQDQPRPRPGHADVAQSPLLFELLLALARTGMRKQLLLETGHHDHRKFEAFRAV